MRPIFFAKFPKEAARPAEYEDACDARQYKGVFAVSDGASESYCSGKWARILVNRFVDRQGVDRDWVASAIAEYNGHFNRDAMGWSAQAAFDRGSFATLLGLVFVSGGVSARIISIGDSLAALVDEGRLVGSYPFQDPEQFRANPLLLSTVMERNAQLMEPGALKHLTTEWQLAGLRHPRILLMTDAIGAWLLAAPEARLGQLLELRSRSAFAALISSERAARRMKRDDTTLLVLG